MEVMQASLEVPLRDVSPLGVQEGGHGLCLISNSLKNMVIPSKEESASTGFNMIYPSERSLKSRAVRGAIDQSRFKSRSHMTPGKESRLLARGEKLREVHRNRK